LLLPSAELAGGWLSAEGLSSELLGLLEELLCALSSADRIERELLALRTSWELLRLRGSCELLRLWSSWEWLRLSSWERLRAESLAELLLFLLSSLLFRTLELLFTASLLLLLAESLGLLTESLLVLLADSVHLLGRWAERVEVEVAWTEGSGRKSCRSSRGWSDGGSWGGSWCRSWGNSWDFRGRGGDSDSDWGRRRRRSGFRGSGRFGGRNESDQLFFDGNVSVFFRNALDDGCAELVRVEVEDEFAGEASRTGRPRAAFIIFLFVLRRNGSSEGSAGDWGGDRSRGRSGGRRSWK